MNMHSITMWLQSLLLLWKDNFYELKTKWKLKDLFYSAIWKSQKIYLQFIYTIWWTSWHTKEHVGNLLSKLVLIWLRNVLHYSNTKQFSTKNKKLFQLKKFTTPTFDVPLLSQLSTYLALISIYKVWNMAFITALLTRVD